MGRPLKIKESATVDTGFNNPAGASNTYGVVGGLTEATGVEILAYVKIGSAAESSTGHILRQKGKNKFLVTDGTNTGVCTLVNKAAGALGNDEMRIEATVDGATQFPLAYLTNRWGIDFSGNLYVLTFNTPSTTPPIGKAGTQGLAQVRGT